MTAPVPVPASAVPSSHKEHGGYALKNLAQNKVDQEGTASRRFFAAMLWRAFPGPSENAVAKKAHRALGVSERQVKNWLRCENSAPVNAVLSVLAIAGAEIVFKHIEGTR